MRAIPFALTFVLGASTLSLTARAAQAAEQWVPVPMALAEKGVDHDSKGIWPDKDVVDSDIWLGHYDSQNPSGVVDVSYLVGGACGAPSACPVKAVFVPRNGGKPQVLADGSDMFCSAKGIEITTDLKKLKGCNGLIKLKPVSAP